MSLYKKLFSLFFKILLLVPVILLIYFSAMCAIPETLLQMLPNGSGVLELKKTRTENGVRYDYQDAFGNIRTAADKHFATLLKTLDRNGNCILEQYLDSRGKIVTLPNGHSGIRREFNSDNQCILVSYLNKKMEPTTIWSGYSSIEQHYDAFGQLVTEFFLDTHGSRTTNRTGVNGYRYTYDQRGLIDSITYIDKEGLPMLSVYGYSTVKLSYSSDKSLLTEMYYGINGEPVPLLEGQYGYEHRSGRTVLVDRDGNEIFRLRHFLLHSFGIVCIIGLLLIVFILRAGKRENTILILLYFMFIIYMTLLFRTSGNTGVIILHLGGNAYSFFSHKEVMENIWLFVPFGCLLYRLFVSHNKLSAAISVILISFLLSVAIETAQALFNIGWYELTDLISNSLGGMIGVILGYLSE